MQGVGASFFTISTTPSVGKAIPKDHSAHPFPICHGTVVGWNLRSMPDRIVDMTSEHGCIKHARLTNSELGNRKSSTYTGRLQVSMHGHFTWLRSPLRCIIMCVVYVLLWLIRNAYHSTM